MNSIEIDFDVFREITNRRASEDVTPNDVLRELLGLPPKREDKVLDIPEGKPWVIKGVVFPHGTEFKVTYRGQEYRGIVDNGALDVNGKRCFSPSAAANEITGNSVNGWYFWKAKMPGSKGWTPIESIRNYELNP